MEYFAGLDVSMEETHICVVDRDGGMVLETKATTSPEAIASGLAKAPGCQRIVFETGRMAPTLYHGLDSLGLPVICIESRQAYQALKSLVTHKTDRNDARGLAHLARTGFYKPVHVKSLPAHAVRALIVARKKLVGQRVTLENQIRGLAVVFGVRLPRGLSPAFAEQAISGSEGIGGLSGAMRGLLAARNAVLKAIAAINGDLKHLARSSEACQRLMTIPGVGQLTALAFVAAIDEPERFRRSRDVGAYLGLSLFLARAEREKQRFIVLDDPVLSSDEDYRVHFDTTVLTELVNLPMQVIVLTQDHTTWKEMETRYRHLGIATAQLFVETPALGAVIENTSDDLLAKINRAKSLARGGHPDSRKECGIQLRDAGERFCKEMLVIRRRTEGHTAASLTDYEGKTLEWLCPHVDPLLGHDPAHPGKLEAFKKTVNAACHDNAPPGNAEMAHACGEIRHLVKEYLHR